MNKIILIIIALFIGANLFAQSHMTIRKTDGTTISVAITEVDSIYYEDIFTCGDILTDIDGNEYGTVQIGNQCWTSESSISTHYHDGTAIPQASSSADWESLGHTGKGYCFYENNESTGVVLYTYSAATNGVIFDTISEATVQGVCPSGWHLPSRAEYNELIDFLGGPSVAGGKLKEIGTTNWIAPNEGADNSSGFTAFPSGFRMNTGSFYYLGEWAGFWSSSEDLQYVERAYYMVVNNEDADASIDEFHYLKNNGMAVRCLKD